MKPSNETKTTGVDVLKPKTRNLVLLLRINLAVNIVGAIISGIEWFFVDSLSMGQHVSHDLFEPVNMLYRNAWYLQFGLYLFTTLVFLS